MIYKDISQKILSISQSDFSEQKVNDILKEIALQEDADFSLLCSFYLDLKWADIDRVTQQEIIERYKSYFNNQACNSNLKKY